MSLIPHTESKNKILHADEILMAREEREKKSSSDSREREEKTLLAIEMFKEDVLNMVAEQCPHLEHRTFVPIINPNFMKKRYGDVKFGHTGKIGIHAQSFLNGWKVNASDFNTRWPFLEVADQVRKDYGHVLEDITDSSRSHKIVFKLSIACKK